MTPNEARLANLKKIRQHFAGYPTVKETLLLVGALPPFADLEPYARPYAYKRRVLNPLLINGDVLLYYTEGGFAFRPAPAA